MKQLFANKQIMIAAVVAGAFAAPAMADVTIYGFVSAGVESVKATGNGDSSKDYKSRTRVSDENSRIGFKGNEDLGNGLKAIWQVESSLKNFEQGGTNDKGETATFATRNSFVGLENASFGKVLLGQNDTAYKALTDIGINAMANTTADTQGATAIFSRGETRLKNSVHYFSPKMAGFELGASYGVDETRPIGTVDGTRQNNDRLSLAGKYTWDALTVAVGYDRQGNKLNSTGTTEDLNKTQFYKLAASYMFPTGTMIGAGIEQGRFDYVSANDTKQTDWTVALSQSFGAATVKLSYSELGALKNAAGNEDDYKAKQWVLGATYDLSKRTQLLAYATKITNNSKAAVNLQNNPVYSEGLGTSGAKLTAGNDPQAFGIGMKHSF
ncbi:porin Gram-negative type [Pseudogulbenkiania sp. NH8B]|uniref:porin n=1 Tax=Pseudogulbenkiania sp. (strain NH8B) TaxID=748280 RepID=UPI000227996D|nr:porin [Pseudogulbenkiania sp. NH8B]BAK77403.1 porin Gram-negative type [Pseudogulbenkiania sp. NH8B]